MRNVRIAKKTIIVLAAFLVVLTGIPLQGYAGTIEDEKYSKEELVQMLAPIALYPDSLLAQILMASTYPLEIVEAERWLKNNKGLEGDKLYSALLDKDWDTSVKSLCNFPDILFALSENLEQTRRLGDAFLLQEEDVMDVVQELREMAYENDNLKTTKEQKVIVEQKVIRIEPAVSTLIYVPVYDPLYVYGPWRYPHHRPYYWYCPPAFSYGVRYVRFSPPFFISIGWFSWAWFDWPCTRIYIVNRDACRYHRHNVHRVGYDDDHYWRHDPHHRRGVDYRHRETRDRFVQKPPDDGYKRHISPDMGRNSPQRSPYKQRTVPEPQQARHKQERNNFQYESPVVKKPKDSTNRTINDRDIGRDVRKDEREKQFPDRDIKISRSDRTSRMEGVKPSNNIFSERQVRQDTFRRGNSH